MSMGIMQSPYHRQHSHSRRIDKGISIWQKLFNLDYNNRSTQFYLDMIYTAKPHSDCRSRQTSSTRPVAWGSLDLRPLSRSPCGLIGPNNIVKQHHRPTSPESVRSLHKDDLGQIIELGPKRTECRRRHRFNECFLFYALPRSAL